MRRTRTASSALWAVAAVVLVGTLAAPPNAAMGAEFRIRKLTVEGAKLLIYHEAVAEDAGTDVSITVGGQVCRVDEGELGKPSRGGDRLTTLIVIDRGGKETTGMGLYSRDIVGAVQQFVAGVLEDSPEEKFAIKDAPGKLRVGKEQEATSDREILDTFLGEMGPPAGAGADIYGTTHGALRLLDATDTKLRAVIMISDGIDPMRKRGTANHVDDLIEAAKEKGVPTSAVHIDRSTGANVRALGSEKRKRFQAASQRGRGMLTKVVDRTHGEIRTVEVGPALQARVLAALTSIGSVYASLARTRCSMCGDHATARHAPVGMVYGRDPYAARSRTEPPVTAYLPATNFGSCEPKVVADSGAAPDVPAAACGADDECEDCKECKDGSCTIIDCGQDTDCFDGCDCEAGICVKEKTLADHLPTILIIAGILGLIGVIYAVMRRQRRREEEMRAASAESDRQTQEAAAKASERAAEEAIRAETERQRLERQITDQQGQMASLAQQMNPVIYRLVSADGSGLVQLDVRSGDHVIGAAPECGLVLEGVTVSGEHAHLSVAEDGVAHITDLDSSNGTYVNDFQIQPNMPVEVRPGDVIAISRRVLVQIEPA